MDENNIKKLVGKKIRFFRKKLGLSQFALGEKIDMDQRQIAYIEGGNSFPSLPTLNKFIKVFECELKDLFDFVEIPAEDVLKSSIIKLLNNLSLNQLQMLYKIITAIEENTL